MNDIDYKFFEEMLRRESGLVITPDKIYLLESRLLPLAAKEGLKGLEGIVAKLRAGAPDLKKSVIDAMTTNETSFFRDSQPFQRLKDDILPVLLKSRAATRQLRIWSAACSSGQEPYTIAMVLKEMGAQLSGWNIEILATDLSNDILAQARQGLYTQFEVQRGLPIQLLVKYFGQVGDKWQIRQEVRNMVTFKQANLLTDVPTLGVFDIVFCRNVLIYFDVANKAKVLGAIKNQIRQDGVLFLGGAETVIGVTDAFKPMPDLRGIYVRNDSTFQNSATPTSCGSHAQKTV